MIQVIKRVFDVLNILHDCGALPLKEITERVSLQKSTCHNILKSLVETGIVESPRAGFYQIGPGLHQLASHPLGDDVLKLAASHHVERLAKTSGETVILGVLKGNAVHVLHAAEGGMDVVVRTDAHKRGSLYRWATGRILLAHAPEAVIARIITELGLPATDDWPSINGDRERLAAKLVEIRQMDILLRSESNEGLTSLACPIRGTDGRVIAALGMSIPSYRAERNIHEITLLLLKTTEEITQELRMA